MVPLMPRRFTLTSSLFTVAGEAVGKTGGGVIGATGEAGAFLLRPRANTLSSNA